MVAGRSDGVMELTAAAMLAVFALLQLVAPVLVPVFVAPIVLFAPRLVLRARGRLTYSRIGYVELPRAARRRIALGMLAFVAGGLAVTLAVVAVTGDIDDPARWRKMAPLFAGLLGSGGFLYAATWSGLAAITRWPGYRPSPVRLPPSSARAQTTGRWPPTCW